jgi:hypothetical protein
MPQHDLDVANGSGAALRSDLNGALAALGSTMKGPNAPPAPVAGMMWVEDDNPSSTRWTVRMFDGADWIALGILDATANTFEPYATATLGAQAAWVDVASAGTTDIGAAAGQAVRITGTTTITSLGTAPNGVTRKLRFAASLTLTHNASSLILPGGASIVTAADDRAEAVSLGGGNWIVTQYTPATAAGMRALAGAGLPAASYVSVLSGVWTGVFDLGLTDATFLDIALPANVQSIIGSGFVVTNQTAGGVDSGVFDVALLNASLVEQSRHMATQILSTTGALSGSGLVVGFNNVQAGNSGWRLRFYGRKITNQGPFNVERYQAHILCVTR